MTTKKGDPCVCGGDVCDETCMRDWPSSASPTVSAADAPPREVWVVSSKEGPEYVAGYQQAAMEHAALMAGDFPEQGPWLVARYIADAFAIS